MKTLTEANTFTSAITVPENGEDRNALSIESPFQALTNRTRNILNRLLALENFATYTMANVGGTPVGGICALSESAYNAGPFVYSGNEITVPRAGTYLVYASCNVDASDNSGTDAVGWGFNLQIGGTTRMSAGGTRQGTASTYSDTVSTMVIQSIPDPATFRIRLQDLRSPRSVSGGRLIVLGLGA